MKRAVELRFGAEVLTREVELGSLATDEHFVDEGRKQIEAERDDLDPFRRGRVVEEMSA